MSDVELRADGIGGYVVLADDIFVGDVKRRSELCVTCGGAFDVIRADGQYLGHDIDAGKAAQRLAPAQEAKP